MLTYSRILTAGVTGPGPKEYAMVERLGLRGITDGPDRYRTTHSGLRRPRGQPHPDAAGGHGG